MPTPEKQRWKAETYQEHTGFVPVLGAPVLELLAPKPGERVLDLGCGDGALTEKLAAAGAEVMGIDASEAMIEAAKARGLDVRTLDATKLDFDQTFDAVFSNAALHWMLDPDAVIAGVHRALKPYGRFVGEFGGHGNVAAITVALLATLAKRGIDGAANSLWYFPTTAAYRARLESAGFEVLSIELIPRPTPLPTDMEGWLRTMAGPFFAALEEADRSAALAETVRLLAPCLRDERGNWTADYVRLRFHAQRTS
ncbi:MAG: methyltransferase domain-containing protein [Alphaproteobacteria bacterium]|nr:methyltransferase domain-containing protein [Alphaproteobacteria bacterium]